MARIRIIPIALLLTTIVACTAESNAPGIDVAEEGMVITQLEKEWSDMYGAGDADSIAGLLAQDTVLIMPGSDPIVGVANVRAATEQMLGSGEQVSWASDFVSVAPSGDMAYDYGTATTVLADGSSVKGHYLVVWVKEGDQWKIAADVFN